MDRPVAVQTDRILAAIASPAVTVIGHPTGRILGHRPGYAIELEAIAQAAAATGTALEVNGSPRRLDLSAEMVRIALGAGATLALSSDAHAVGELDYLHNAVATARRGWATPATSSTPAPPPSWAAAPDGPVDRWLRCRRDDGARNGMAALSIRDLDDRVRHRLAG